jgi:3-oxoacyl-[acyl-carrier-protein] synthase II
MNAVIVQADAVTAYGWGISPCWEGLLEGRSAIRSTDRFAQRPFASTQAALAPDLPCTERSRVLSLLAPLLRRMRPNIPEDAALLLATTTGEVELLENHILQGAPESEASHPNRLLQTVRRITGVTGPGAVVSCACASSSVALGWAAEMVQTGRNDAVLVAACDAITEFVYAGFSALMALSPAPARPFNRDRDGLSLGEAAAVALVMSPERARREGRAAITEIAGWAATSDANHMTGPSRDGTGLADAMEAAFASAGVTAGQMGSINAHGTGTLYNDAMELKALRRVFGDGGAPLYSIKGGAGHTLGAAGLLEILVAAESLRLGIVPPCVGTRDPDDDAAAWVTQQPLEAKGARHVLCLNSGFGGVNCAVVLRQPS